jgi:NADP-dependent 3-hydroxy-3-methylglutaryl-CoA reductase
MSERMDRRGRGRLWLRPEQGVQLQFEQAGELVRADVLDLSERGLRVELASDLAGDEATVQGRLLQGQEELASGLELTVARSEPRGERTVVSLRAKSDGAIGVLWRAMLRLQEGEPADGPSTEGSPGPQPGEAGEALPKIPAHGLHSEAARRERLTWLERETRTDLEPLAATQLRAERLANNIENLVGAVEVPVGIAGPLLVRGRSAQGLFYLPMATTEGALVASVVRGSQTLTKAGGVSCRVIRQQMIRVPLFVCATLEAALVLARWLTDHREDLREKTRSVSRHASLIAVEPVVVGNTVHARFVYETGDAAGQNMSTACTWHACQWLMTQLPAPGIEVESFLIEGNMSGDKKVSLSSFGAGRGVRVVSEAVIPRAVLKRFLKVTPEQVAEANAAALMGAIQSGMVGYNINVANVIAGVFTATGQDIACVHESAVALLDLRPVDSGLYASLVLPSLVIGTVGGGTHLPQQRALLQMMGCAGAGKVGRLAELIAGFALALELSTACAVAGGQFASAHERLGRNRPVRWLTREELTPAFFEPGLRRALGNEHLRVESVEALPVDPQAGILSELSARRVPKPVGLFPYRLRHGAGHTDVMVKLKPLDAEVVQMMATLATMCGQRVEEPFKRHRGRLEYVGGHLRELGVYRQTDARFVRHVPRVYGLVEDESRETYALVLEKLEGLVQMDAVNDLSGWTPAPIEAVLKGAAALHSIWLGREEALLAEPWLGPVRGAHELSQMVDLFEALAAYAEEELPELMDARTLARQQALIDSLPAWSAELEAMPRTLIHNDFNPRNLGLRQKPEGLTLCAYDWELATLGVPQRDLAELLTFVLTPEATREEVDRWIEVHREALERESGRTFPKDRWRRGYALGLRDLAVQRFSFYLALHVFRPYPFLERAHRTLWHLLSLEGS